MALIHDDAGGVQASKGIITACGVSNVHDTTPTAASLAAEYALVDGAAAGKIITVNDAAGGTNFYIVASDGTNYFYLKMTKAV